MATFNGAAFLEAQIDSILRQLQPRDELVVSDDGSTDGTQEILASYGDRIRIVGTTPSGGVVANFERALAAARGDLIALSDQDDVWLDGRVALLREHLRHVALVLMNGDVADRDLKPVGNSVFARVGSRGGFLRTLAANGYIGCCMAFRRELLDVAVPFPKGIAAHDWFLGLVAERWFDVGRDDRSTLLYRRHGGNASTTGSRSGRPLWSRLADRVRMVRALAVVARRRAAHRAGRDADPASAVRLRQPEQGRRAEASVRVLLATFDGERWLGEQLASLAAQVGVAVSVIASDDSSTDGTAAILQAAARPGTFVVLPRAPERFGNAHRNFMRLIRDTPLDDVEYFALSDQDDIWLPDKLARAVELLRASGADAYGANVTAFWPDGRRKLLVKSQPQRRFDHLFESAGPGCSFVFRRSAFVELQRWVRANFEALQSIKVHDWLIYAHGRESGWRWDIDPASVMLYRQHERNEAGANTGWRGAWPRLRNVREGRFRLDVLAIGTIVGSRAEALDRLRRMSPADRIWLALHAREFRRAFKDVAALALMLLVMPVRKR